MTLSKHNLFQGQNYKKIKRKYRKRKLLFEDPEFQANDSSIYCSSQGKLTGISWMRPGELVEDPKLFVDGASSSDVTQGKVGNCWFVAACSSLAQEKSLWRQIIPDHREQDWDARHPEKYAGIFHFRFWRFGDWVDVVIDDRLPVMDGTLIFTHSRVKNEFWSALLEKAYAKLNGCYEALDGGNLSDALVDFTGGICESVEIRGPDTNYWKDPDKQKELFKTLVREVGRHSLMSAAIDVSAESERETRTPEGLIKGHAYAITAVRKVYTKDTDLLQLMKFRASEKFYMIRLKNPWGRSEWRGPFSDSSPEWEKVTASQREKLGLTYEDDGEFWMTFDDFCENFTHLAICYIMNTAYFTLQKTWIETKVWSKWIKGPVGSKTDRAGGCVNFPTFLQNPQYFLAIIEGAFEKEEILFYLTQKDKREMKVYQNSKNLTIGFSIYKVEENRMYRVHDVRYTTKYGQSDYIKSRSIFLRQLMVPGKYMILPTTFEPGEEGEFLLRLYSPNKISFNMARLDYPKRTIFSGCVGYPTCVYRIAVNHATTLEKQDRMGGSADPYVIVSCEKKKYRSKVVKDSTDPIWDQSFLFYCKKRDSPIKLEIWNHNLVKDSFMGQATISPRIDDSTQNLEISLMGKGRRPSVAKPGTLTIQITASDNIKTFF